MTANAQSKKKTGSAKARRSAARLAATQAVYQQLNNDQTVDDVINEYLSYRLGLPVDGQEMVTPDRTLFTAIVRGTHDRKDDLTGIILPLVHKSAEEEGSKSHDLDSLLMAILLCGGFELMAHHDIDVPVIISDYLHVTHAFYEQGESRLVNAVLDKIGTSLRS
ncbi:MAG: transcription antitermination protein NusB [Rhodospirillales bacterium]|nr:transcription antitermination protein NusB [Rhodospirillales bacterium]